MEELRKLCQYPAMTKSHVLDYDWLIQLERDQRVFTQT